MTAMDTSSAHISGNPYVGPRTFSEAQSQLFFGREWEARDLTARVVSERLTLFYAQSGAGKSSLINTRLIPNLRETEGYQVLPVGRVSGHLPDGVENVDNIYTFNLISSLDQSGDDPARLAQVPLNQFLASVALEWATDAQGQRVRRWAYRPRAITPPYPVASSAPTQGPRFALIIDQFEEIITGHPERWAERESFFRQLNQALLDDPSLWTVLTLREDYVAALDPYADLLFNRLRARFYMERMGTEAALEAIQQPAQLGGRPFASGVAEQLVDNLRQVRVMGQQASVPGQYVEPVQLQVVCYQLWENLTQAAGDSQPNTSAIITKDDLQAAGDVDEALGQFYEEALMAVVADPDTDVSERQLRTWFASQLLTEAGTRGLVHRGEAASAGLPNEVADLLVQKFLLRTELRAGGAWIELVHDRFVEPITRNNEAWWPRNLSTLQRQAALWQEENRSAGLLLRGDALREAEEWAARQSEELEEHEIAFLEACRVAVALETREQQQNRRLRLLSLVAVLFAVASIWLAVTANNSSRDADNARATAVAEAERAETQTRAARAAEATAVAEKGRAQEAQEEADREAENARSSLVGQFALQARILSQAEPQYSSLLAVESAILSRSMSTERQNSDIEQAFFDVLSQPAGLPLPGHRGNAGAFAFSSDSRWLIVGGTDGAIQRWQLERLSDGPTALAALPDAIRNLSFTPDNHKLIAVEENNSVTVWSFADDEIHGEPLQFHCEYWGPETEYQTSRNMIISVSPDNRWLAIGGGAAEQVVVGPGSYKRVNGFPVCLWSLDSTEPSSSGGNEGEIVASDGLHLFTRDSRWLIVSDSQEGIRAIELNSSNVDGEDRKELQLTSVTPYGGIGYQALQSSVDGVWLAAQDTYYSYRTCLWNLAGLAESEPTISTEDCFQDYSSLQTSSHLFFNRDNNGLFSIADSTINEWLLTPEGRGDGRNITYASFPIGHSAYSEQTDIVVLESRGAMRFWKGSESLFAPDNFLLEVPGQDTPIADMKFSPDGAWLVSTDRYGSLRLWFTGQIDSRGMPNPLPLRFTAAPVEISGSGRSEGSNPTRYFVIKNADGEYEVRDADKPESDGRVIDNPGKTDAIHIGVSGRWMATTQSSNSIVVAEKQAANGEWFQGASIEGQFIAASPNGRWIVYRDSDKNGQVWESSQQRSIATIQNLQFALFSPDSRWLRTTDTNRQTILWELRSDGLAEAYQGTDQREADYFARGIFSPGGRFYIWNMTSDSIAVVDLSTTDPFSQSRVIEEVRGELAIAVFSPDETTQAFVATTLSSYHLRFSADSRVEITRLPRVEIYDTRFVTFSQEGKWLITPDGFYFGTPTLAIWNTNDFSGSIELEANPTITSAVIADDSRTLAVVDEQGGFHLYRLQEDTWTYERTLDSGYYPYGIAFDRTGKRIIASGFRQGEESVRVWDIAESGEQTPVYAIDMASLTTAGYRPDFSPVVNGRWLPLLHNELQAIYIYDLTAVDPTEPVLELTHGANHILQQTSTQDGKWMVVEWSDGMVYRIDLQADSVLPAAEVIGKLEGQIDNVTATTDGDRLLLGKSQVAIALWNLEAGQKLKQPQLKGSTWGYLAEIMDGGVQPWAIIGNNFTHNYLWNIDSADLPVLLPSDVTLMPSPDGRWLLGKSYSNSSLTLWNIGDDNSLQSIQVEEISEQSNMWIVGFSPDSSLFAGYESRYDIDSFDLILWETNRPSQPLRRLNLQGIDGLNDLAFPASISPDNRWLALGSSTGTVLLWDLHRDSDTPIHEWKAHEDTIQSLTFSSIGTRMLTQSYTGEIGFWNLEQSVVTGIRFESTEIIPLNFSEDGRWLVQRGSGTIQFWPTQVEDLEKLACQNAGRNLTIQEWEELFPNQEYRVTCPEFPVHPSLTTSYLEQGRTLAQQGEIEQAAAAFEQAKEYGVREFVDAEKEAKRIYGSVLAEEARQLAQQGEITEAVTRFTQALEFSPALGINPESAANSEYAGSLYSEGLNLATQGDIGNSLTKLSQALEVEPNLGFDPKSMILDILGPITLEQITAALVAGDEADALELVKMIQPLSADTGILPFDLQLCRLGRYQALTETVDPGCQRLNKAHQIAPNEVVTGTVQNQFGDLWMLTIDQSSFVTITLSAAEDSYLDSYLQLYDARFDLIAYHDDIQPRVLQDSIAPNTRLQPGHYWIVATRCCPEDNQGSIGEYIMEVTAAAIEESTQ